MLPGKLLDKINRMLELLGDNRPILQIRPVGGGCINQAVCLVNEKNKYFLKYNSQPFPGMFEAESKGLKLMQETKTIRIPQVYAVGEINGQDPAFILLEWLEVDEKGGQKDSQFNFGQRLAHMHRSQPQEGIARYGLDFLNYIGSNPQENDWEDDWVTFFRDHRLGFQFHLAIRNGYMPHEREKRMISLMDHLEKYIGSRKSIKPSLLHGDLWSGNKIQAGNGFALIDPVVYYGDHETDLAFTELFGGFHPAFYQGYAEVFPIDPEYKERKNIYNLYHLLNHLNLFGEGYGSQVDSILRRYLG